MATERHNPTNRHNQRGGSHQFHCHGCGEAFPHKSGIGLHHSAKCEKADAKKKAQLAARIVAQGFKQNKKAPNVFTKNGVSITLEQVKIDGLKETLKAHAAVKA